MYIYLAHPIDQETHKLEDRIAQGTDALTAAGLDVYRPGAAWAVGQNNPHPGIQATNRAALLNSSGLLVIWPEGSATYGVGIEVGEASALGLPIAIITQARSYALLGTPGVTTFEDIGAASGWLAKVARAPRPNTNIARWTGYGHQPSRAYTNDAGFDLTYSGDQPITILHGDTADIPARVSIQWPDGMWGLVLGRSSSFRNRGLLVNPAVIDHGYRGELYAIVRNISHGPQTIEPGERIAQIIPMPTCADQMQMVYVEELDDSDRGANGFGSSGL